MRTGVHWGLEELSKAGNTGTMPAVYLRNTWEIARSRFDVIKISNAKIFVVFIFVWPNIIQNIRKFAQIQNFLLSTKVALKLWTTVHSRGIGKQQPDGCNQ